MVNAVVVEGRRRKLVQEAFVLEYMVLAWRVIEAGVAIAAGPLSETLMFFPPSPSMMLFEPFVPLSVIVSLLVL